MVTHNYSVEEELRIMLSNITDELNELEKEKSQIDNKITQLNEEKRAYENTLQSYVKRTGKQVSLEPDWNALRRDPSHKARLIRLARYNGGRITVRESSALLYTKRIIKSKRQKNAYQIVRGLLDQMVDEKLFEKVAPGEFRLIDSQSSLPILNGQHP
jgi:hypothetical protein